MPLIDKNTGVSVVHYDDTASSEKMTQDYQSGNYNFPSDQERVTMFMPYQSGQRKLFHVPVNRVQDALNDGAHIESSRDRAGREWGESDEASGAWSVAGQSGFNSLMMGAPELYQKLNGNPLESAKNEWLKREYVTADWLGAGAGTIANLFVTGGTGAALKTGIGKGATKLITQRAMARGASKEAAERTAEKFVKHVGTNIGTSMVLGTAEMAPLAATEAIWGDPSKAGEYLMMGSLIGGGIGGTLALGGSVARGATKTVGSLMKSDAVKNIGIKGLAGVTGAPDWAIKYNIANPGKVRNAKPTQDFANEMNRGKQHEVGIVQSAKEASKDADEHFNVMEQNLTRQMDQVAREADDVVADRITEDVGVKLKELVGLQSSQADDILENSVIKLNKNVVTGPLKKEIARLKKPGNFGDTNKSMLARMEQLAEELDALPKVLDGPQSRRVIRSFSDDSVFNKQAAAAGMFDEKWSLLNKGFRKTISDKLKKISPEYAAKMAEIAPLSEAADKMYKTFKTRTGQLDIARILATPDHILKRKPTDWAKSREINDILIALDDFAHPGILKQYETLIGDKIKAIKYMDDHKTLWSSKSKNKKGNFTDLYLKEPALHRQKLKDEMVDAENNFRIMRPAIGSEGSEYLNPQKLKKMMAKEGDETMDNARELFFARNGYNFDDVEASIVADAFLKAKPAGSKYVNLGMLGGFGFGWSGAVAGAVMGAGMENVGGRIARGMTNGKMASWLSTEKIIGNMAKQLDRIPNNIHKAGSGTAQANIERLGVKMYRDLYIEMSERERKKAGMTSTKATAENVGTREVQLNFWKAMTARSEKFRSDPQVMMNEIMMKTDLISGDEALSGGMVEHMIRANDYLDEVIPKDPMPESPFIEEDEKFEPSDYDLDVFNQQVLAVNNPLVIVDALLDDTLTREMTDAVAATSPTILEHVQEKMTEAIAENPKSFDYSKRISGSYIMGMELDATASPKSYLYYQSTMGAEEEQEQQGKFAPDLKTDPSVHKTKMTKLEGGLS